MGTMAYSFVASQRQKAFDQLGETDYCSILAYLAYGLKKNEIAWLETGLEKYLFLHHIPVSYPRGVGCDCSYNDHLMAIMWECYKQTVKPLEENCVYNFTSLPRVLNNIYARPTHFAYYEKPISNNENRDITSVQGRCCRQIHEDTNQGWPVPLLEALSKQECLTQTSPITWTRCLRNI